MYHQDPPKRRNQEKLFSKPRIRRWVPDKNKRTKDWSNYQSEAPISNVRPKRKRNTTGITINKLGNYLIIQF